MVTAGSLNLDQHGWPVIIRRGAATAVGVVVLLTAMTAAGVTADPATQGASVGHSATALAPIVTFYLGETHEAGSDAAADRVEALVAAEPGIYSGEWRDPESGRLMAGYGPDANSEQRAALVAAVGSVGTVVAAKRSYTELLALRDAVASDGLEFAGVKSCAVGPYQAIDGVAVCLVEVTDAARAYLAARYGDAVGVYQGALFRNG